MDSDLMIEQEVEFGKNTFISVKSYHTKEDLLFNGFIACSKFNPIIYSALKHAYTIDNIVLEKDYFMK